MESIGDTQRYKYINKTINDNEGLNIKPSMNNGIDSSKVDYLADELVRKFGSERSREFYCKAVYALGGNEDTINRLAVQALEKGNNPGALFNHLVTKEIRALKARRVSGHSHAA